MANAASNMRTTTFSAGDALEEAHYRLSIAQACYSDVAFRRGEDHVVLLVTMSVLNHLLSADDYRKQLPAGKYVEISYSTTYNISGAFSIAHNREPHLNEAKA